jgi:phosphatidylglycerophosphatase A
MGALAAVGIAALLVHYAGWTPLHLGILGLIAVVPGTWASSVEAQTCGRKDPGHIVVDEVAGQWITIAGAAALNWKAWLAAFVLFRLFDIWKPAPVRQLERLPGGVGVMADDVMAGVYGALVLAVGGWFNLY